MSYKDLGSWWVGEGAIIGGRYNRIQLTSSDTIWERNTKDQDDKVKQHKLQMT